MALLLERAYNPDVLSCLANLSNDEVFTPPEVANQMLDLLPPEIWKSRDIKILDPACKTGVFLREAAKRFIDAQIPGYQEIARGVNEKIRNDEELTAADKYFLSDLEIVVEHVFKNQLYGIAITEMTSLLSRRGVYCSKYPNSKYSIAVFDNPEGNIRYRRTTHTWVDDRCVYCGAPKSIFDRTDDLETYAYELIHVDNPEEIFDMKFDVIISNPPYQLSVGNEGGNAAKAKAIYHRFIEEAMQLHPKYLVMITPSRWMTRSTEGIPSEWVDKMLSENKIEEMHDFLKASDCFPGVEIKGGVNYFLWNRDYDGDCHYYSHFANGEVVKERVAKLDALGAGIVIRDPEAYSIIQKIMDVEGDYVNDEEKNFSGLVSPKDFFTTKTALTSKWDGYVDAPDNEHAIKYYMNKNVNGSSFGFVSLDQIPKNQRLR